MPLPNEPNVAGQLRMPPAPTEFEVADLKPSPPDSHATMIQLERGGRMHAQGAPLKFLVQLAWNIQSEFIVNAPEWMDTDRYDIEAKAPASGGQIDADDLWPMMRALLIERFRIRWHMEERPEKAWTLVAVKPKMKLADPAERTKYKEGPGADGRDPRDRNPVLSRLVTFQNMTMAQFAEKLQMIAAGYIRTPVLDRTGLEGGYDFTLSFSPVGAGRRVPAGAGRGTESAPTSAADSAAASDPSGAISLFEAIERQLGLKLQEEKRAVQVLVINAAERKPTEN